MICKTFLSDKIAIIGLKIEIVNLAYVGKVQILQTQQTQYTISKKWKIYDELMLEQSQIGKWCFMASAVFQTQAPSLRASI